MRKAASSPDDFFLKFIYLDEELTEKLFTNAMDIKSSVDPFRHSAYFYFIYQGFVDVTSPKTGLNVSMMTKGQWFIINQETKNLRKYHERKES